MRIHGSTYDRPVSVPRDSASGEASPEAVPLTRPTAI